MDGVIGLSVQGRIAVGPAAGGHVSRIVNQARERFAFKVVDGKKMNVAFDKDRSVDVDFDHASTPVFSPDGTKIAYAAWIGGRVQPLCRLEPRRLRRSNRQRHLGESPEVTRGRPDSGLEVSSTEDGALCLRITI